jgi:Uma2 family endonuclease
MDVLKKKKISFEEYLEIEQAEGVKYEYHQGEIFAMAGGTNNHARICTNLSRATGNELIKKASKCEAFNAEAKLYIPSEDRAFYPDAMVICEEDKEEGTEHFMTNPTVIIEVLSDSTEKYDRGEKFRYYRKIPTLREYILIDQKTAEVEVFKKMSDLWHTRFISGLDKKLQIESLDIEIDLTEIYRGVEFLPSES